MKGLKFDGMKKDFLVAKYFLRLTHKISNRYIPLLLVSSIFKAIAPFINIIMPKFIIDELMGQKRIDHFILYVAITILGNGLFELINRFFDTKVDIANMALINGFELYMGKHIMNMDFEKIEDPEILDLKEKALFPINNQGVMWRMISSIITLVQTIITIIGLIALVATLNIIIIIVIMGIVLLNAFIFKKSQENQFKFHQELIPLNRKFGYYARLTSDFSMGKDVRLYNMSPFILGKIDEYVRESFGGFSKLFEIQGKYNGLSNINIQIQMVIVYGYMVYKVLMRTIGIGDFTMYVNATYNFSNSLSSFLTTFVEFRQMCRYLDLYIQFEQIPSRYRDGNRAVKDLNEISIEFKNVYFRYPRSQDYVLKNVSIKIDKGEKLSIVGQNGAGKTTFVKLLCRLYEPEKGQILINGIDIREFDYDEYMKLLAVVFQDFKLFSFTVKENIAFDSANGASDEKIEDALRKAGLYDKVQALEKGINTSIYKNFDEKGVELSGGEGQKLAIARAIHKDAPIIVLDEPTAALDPYAEYEIYSRLNDLVSGNTAIYISHRLSSCRFCDKIAVFDKGEIVEYGSHDELVDNSKKYREMWEAQAQYYI